MTIGTQGVKLALAGAVAVALAPAGLLAQGVCTGTPIHGDEWTLHGVASDVGAGGGYTSDYGTANLVAQSGYSRLHYLGGVSLVGGGGFNLCWPIEIMSHSTGSSNVSSIGTGLGLAIGSQSFAAFAAPVVGYGAGASYYAVQSGASLRLGRLIGGVDARLPMGASYADPSFSFRLGWIFGSATPKSATPPTAQQPAATQPRPATPAPATPAPAASPAPAATQPAAAPSAGTRPYSLDDVEAMVRNELTTGRILDLARRSCVSFRMNDAADTRLRRVGAEPELLNGLRGICFSAE